MKLNPPATATDFKRAEAILKFNFPDDFKALYALANGFEDYEWQEHTFSFWSLDRIIEEMDSQDNNDFIGFCDFLILSHVIGFRKKMVGVFKEYPQINQRHWEPISQTFTQALYMINNSSGEIY